ncbi:hypothetical protein ACH5RR_025526 [Cinchona calisaya]|uniref:Reverse transcriptase RNase H-like domain-containing protein n=1 Tax=Cinchona calisaya TaxID=153742 RepID=A0ABD2Z109_9GENT
MAEIELLSLITTVTRWRHYLVGAHFIIITDQQSLKYLLQQKITTPSQLKQLTKLLRLDYEIHYTKGEENLVANTLSRRDEENEDSVHALSMVKPTWLSEVSDSYIGDEKGKELLLSISLQANCQHGYSYGQGVIRYKGRLYIGAANDLRVKLLSFMHELPIGDILGCRALTRG